MSFRLSLTIMIFAPFLRLGLAVDFGEEIGGTKWGENRTSYCRGIAVKLTGV